MQVYLPEPYPGELFKSVIARYLKRICSRRSRQSTYNIFKDYGVSNAILPGRLNAVAESTKIIWNMTAEDIVERLTLFPFYARYIAKKRRDAYYSSLLHEQSRLLPMQLGIQGQRVKTHPYLRYCPVCLKNDLSRYGETYWHRSHQMTGILVCPEHGARLQDPVVHVPIFDKKRSNQYYDATHVLANAKAIYDKTSDVCDVRSLEYRLAVRCQDILLGRVPECWNSENIHESYQIAAEERGLAKNATYLDIPKIERDLISFYGDKLLGRINCQMALGKHNNWVRSIFRKHENTFSPIQHAMVQLFLEGLPKKRDNHEKKFGSGPWKCPNKYAKHTEKYPISRECISIKFAKNDKVEAHASCSCGFHFNFLKVDDNDSSLPIVHKITRRGLMWQNKVRSLRRQGHSFRVVSEIMGLKYPADAENLLNARFSTGKIRWRDIRRLRNEWKMICDRPFSATMARDKKRKKYIYRVLQKHDSNWLTDNMRTKKRQCAYRINWEKRDIEWSNVLDQAARRIKRSMSLTKITMPKIISEAGLKESTIRWKFDRLPRCYTVLKKYGESYDESHQDKRYDRSSA